MGEYLKFGGKKAATNRNGDGVLLGQVQRA